MKTKIYAVLLMIIFSIGFMGSVLPESSVGLLTKVIQKVEYKEKASNSWDNAKIGTVLFNGDGVKTDKRSLALIKFLDNSLLRVRENSIVTVYGNKEKSKLNKNTEIEQGKVGFEVTDQGDQEFKFTTPTGVASIRGTEGFIDVMGNGISRLYVHKGLVFFQSSLGNKQSGNVGAGKFAEINSNGDLTIRNATDDILNEYQNILRTNTKKVRIKTNTGDEYIIEYLE